MSKNLSKNNKFVSISEAAEILNVSIDTVRRWDNKGILHAQRPDGKNRYFSIEELEKVKFGQGLPIREAVKNLGISATTLRRLEKKGLIKPERNKTGERIYTKKTLEAFLNSQYFLRQKAIGEKILEPLKEPDQKETKEKTPEETTHKILGAVQEKISQEVSKLVFFRKIFYASGLFILTVSTLLIIIITVLFLLFPESTAKFLGYKTQDSQKLSLATDRVLGATYKPRENQPRVLGAALKPFSTISLGIVKQIDIQTYEKVIPKKAIEDVNDVLTIDKEGNVSLLYNLTLPNTSYLQIPDKELITNLNADYLRGKSWGTQEGEMPLFGSGGTISGLSVAGANIQNGAVVNAHIASGAEITDSKLAQITTSDKVAGSAVQLKSGGGIINDNGLGLTNSLAGDGLSLSNGVLNINSSTGIVLTNDKLTLDQSFSPTWTGTHTFQSSTYFPGSGIWKSDGNVGIGTTTPGSKLDVVGAASISGQLNLASHIIPYTTGQLDLGSPTQRWQNLYVNNLNAASSASMAEALTLYTTPTIQSTAMQTLTLGSATTGNIVLAPAGSATMTVLGTGNVGIGTTTPNGKLEIVGTADDQQLIVKANSSQTANLQEWQNSSGTAISAISSSGTMYLDSGIFGLTGANAVVDVGWRYNSSSTQYGLQFAVQQSGSGNLYGITGNAKLSGSGNISAIAGASFGVGSNPGTAGNITNAYGLNIVAPGFSGDGTVSNVYGLYIDSVSGGASSNYAIRTKNGNIVFNDDGDISTDFRVEGDADANLLFTDASADSVGIGTNAPTGKLTIVGTADDQQLIVKGYSTQTATNLMEWQTSTGTVLGGMSGDGRLGVGSAPVANVGAFITDSNTNPSATNFSLENVLINNYTADNAIQSRANANYLYLTTSSGVTLSNQQMVYHGAVYTRTANAGTINGVFGNYFYTAQEAGAAGALGTAILYNASNYAAGANTLAIGIWRAYNVDDISAALFNGATVGYAYGLNIGSITAGTTANYAIVTNAGNIVFNEGGDASTDLRIEGDTDTNLFFTDASTDSVGIGTTAPATKLNVYGDTASDIKIRVQNEGAGDEMISFVDIGIKAWAIGMDSNIFKIADIEGFGTAGRDRFVIDTNGNVGIATTTPNARLDVVSTLGTSPAASFSANSSFAALSVDNATGDLFTASSSGLNRFVIKQSGRVGIGTTAPSAVLSLFASSGSLLSLGSANSFSFSRDVDTGALSLQGTQVGFNNIILGPTSGNVGIGTTTAATSLTVQGVGHFYPSGTTPDNSYPASLRITQPAASGQYINLVREGQWPWSIGTVYNSSSFAIGNSTVTDSQFTNPFFVITTTGNLGLGTPTPYAKLDVKSTLGTSPAASISATSSFAALSVNNTIGDLFTASSSGLSRFVISNAGNVGIGNTAPTAKLDVTNTTLTSGTALGINTSNPAVNSTVGTLTTGKLIDINSANHNYLTLDNRDLTIGGHKNNLSGISNVTGMFIYDTAKDIDGGRWTTDERTETSSWYKETITATAGCAIASNTRCGAAFFPKKAVLVTTIDSLYIFDAKDNSLWMTFNQAANTALGVALNNDLSSVAAINGQVVVGTNGSAATGLYVVDFIKDKITRYNATDARDYSGTIAARNTDMSATYDYPNQTRTTLLLPNSINQINDVAINVVNGKTYIAAAAGTSAQATQTNGSIILINETAQTTANFGITSGNFYAKKVFLTSVGDLYWTIAATANPTNYWLKAKHNVDSSSGNNVAAAEIYGTSSVTAFGVLTTDAAAPTFTGNGPAPVDNTFVPSSIYVTTATSTADGVGNTIYIGNADNLMVINENRTTPASGSVKYYNSTEITEEVLGNIGGSYAMADASGNLTDSGPRQNTLTASGTALTYQTAGGVRGKTATWAAGSIASSTNANIMFAYTLGLTVGAWVRPGTPTVTNGTRELWVSSDANVLNTVTWGIGTKGNGTDAVIYCYGTNSTPTLTEINTNVPARANTWYHVVLTVSTGGSGNCYVNGILSAAAGAFGATSQTPTRFQVGAAQATTAINAVRGDIDSVFVTKQIYNAAQIRHIYDLGYRALQNHTQTTLRGTTVLADNRNALNSSSAVTGVSADLESGEIYIGTGGGVSVVGMYSDTINDLLTTTATDDTNTAFGSNTVLGVSAGKGYGTNGLFAAFYGSGVWIESGATVVKDFLAQSYNPFGSSLTQSQFNVDNLLRVVGQATSRDDNEAFNTTNQPAISEAFRVDSYGSLLAKSLVNSATAFQFQNAAGTNVFLIDTSTSALTVTGTSTQTSTATTGNVMAISGTTLTTGSGIVFTGGTAMRTGSPFRIASATYVHTAVETGNVVDINFSDASTLATSGNTVTNGLNIASTINTSGATATKEINALNVASPTQSGCTGGACTWTGLKITVPGPASNITPYGIQVLGGSALTTSNLLTIGSATTNFTHITAETGNLTNLTFTDNSTNVSGNSITAAININSTINTSGAGTKKIEGINISAPTITGCAAGACTWDGMEINTVASGAIANLTSNGLNIVATGISAGTLTGINFGAITAGAGTETAMAVGSGWDNVLTVNGAVVIDGTGAFSVTQASGTLPISHGGTNATSYSGTNGIIYYNGSAFASTLAGGAGTLCLVSTDGGVPTFSACSGSNATALSSITAASVDNTVASGDNAQDWNWTLTTAAKTGMTFGETAASTNGAGSQYILSASTLADSTAAPFNVIARGNKIIDTTSTGGITIGNATAAQTITVDAGTGAINVGNSANAKTITIGSNTGASVLNLKSTTLNLQAGTGSILLSGTATGTNATFLGLPVKTDSGDPTATQTNGAMYYNSNSGVFRCYENGTWKNCLNTGAVAGVTLGPADADTVSGANSAIKISHTGTGNLLELQKSGTDKFVVGNNGGLTVSQATSNVVKTTTGTTNPTDFSLAGSTLTNVSSTNDTITVDNGSIPSAGQGTMAASAVITSGLAGAGAQTILRDDGQYVIIHGNSLATGSLWDGSSGTMTSVTVATGATNPGAGAIALKRPDGRYLIVHGNSSAGLTSLYDPWGVTATAAGPAVCGGGAATTGTNAFLRADGKYVILCGGLTAWGIYDPTANTYTAGTAVASAFGAGAHAIQRDDGTFLVFRGGNTTSHWLYNPFVSATGTMTLDPITSNAPTVTTGAFSIRRYDGKFLVLPGAQNTSYIYDPTETSANSGAGTMTAQTVDVGYGPRGAALADGAQALWRQDGTYLLLIGSGSLTTNIIDPSKSDNTQFIAGPNLPGSPGAGVHAFLRPNGQYQIIRGGAGNVTDNYDIGYIVGGSSSGVQLASYETECITSSTLNVNSRLFWSINQEGTINFQAKTGAGACSGSYKDILNSGDLILPTAGDNRIQIKVFFKKPLPKFADQEWALRRGLGQVRYRRINSDPTLLDLTVDNSTMLHRTQFEFGNSSDPSGPVAVNLINDKDRNLSIALALGFGYGTTINATNPQVYNGAFGTHTSLLTTASNGTVVMKRPDNKFIVISGNTATPNAQVYDPTTQAFTALGTAPAAGAGLGALAFKRPDGKFLIVLGNSSNATSIFDPIANTFAIGPNLTGSAGRGALIIPLPNGRVLILHGGFLTTSTVYDPYQNTTVAGPYTSAVVGGGSMAIPRPDGTYLVILGIATEACTALNTVTNNFNPYTMVFTATGSPAITTGVGPGAFAFQRSDGQWVIVHGGGTAATCAGVTRTQIYNPVTNQSVVGPVLSAVAQKGAHAIPRPDGTWLVVHGGGLTTTSIYQEQTGAFTSGGLAGIGVFVAGPALPTASSDGSISFQRDDGKFVTITGNGGTVVQQYDAGWVDKGIYKSEHFNVATLDNSSTLTWRATPNMSGISAEVRTATSQLGLQSAAAREVPFSGALINPGLSETWLQVNFNFKRTFPSYSGIWSDVWYNGGSTTNFTQRKITTPTVTEYKVDNNADLLNLKTDNLSMFRVTSTGDIFSSFLGSVNTGGADLAERYTSQTSLDKGEVVAIDPNNNHGVKLSTYQYQTDILGVVSTQPGFVAGTYTEDSYPIALIGRIPVKVSNENGLIRTGDYLTASSVPGHAMKATMAGRVLGKALETLDSANLTDCPASDIYLPGRKCGTVMMFVNLVDYLGAPVELVMAEKNNGIILNQTTGKQTQILSFLEELKKEREISQTILSEVFADRVSTVNEIISPQIVTDILYAKKIKADSIEGFEILTDKIAALSASKEATVSGTPSSSVLDSKIATDSASPRYNSSVEFESGKFSQDLTILGKLKAEGETIFGKLVTFISNVIFKGEVTFLGRPTFNKDTAGFAVIAKDADAVSVSFEKEYADTPLVNISITLDNNVDQNASATEQLQQETLQLALEKQVLDENIRYIVTKRTPKGFIIKLNKPAGVDLKFSWSALAVKDAKTSISAVAPSPSPTLVPVFSPSPAPSVIPGVTPSATSSAALSASPSPSSNSEAQGNAGPDFKD